MSEEQDPLLAALGGEDNSNDNNATAAVPEEEPPRIDPEQEARNKALGQFKKKLLEHRRYDDQLKQRRQNIRNLEKLYDKTENDIKALQSIGQLIGEVMKELSEEKYIVKASSGPRYIVGVRNSVDRSKLKKGVRVTLDITTSVSYTHLDVYKRQGRTFNTQMTTPKYTIYLNLRIFSSIFITIDTKTWR